MSWKRGLVTKGSGPEQALWKLLNEMGLCYDMNVPEDRWTDDQISFSVYPRELDVIVEGVLGIEVQGGPDNPKLHGGRLRGRKDDAKKWSVYARGLGWMELLDSELHKALYWKQGEDDKPGHWVYPEATSKEWTMVIRDMILSSLAWARRVNQLYREYRTRLPELPLVLHPEYGAVRVDERNE